LKREILVLVWNLPPGQWKTKGETRGYKRTGCFLEENIGELVVGSIQGNREGDKKHGIPHHQQESRETDWGVKEGIGSNPSVRGR